MTLVPGTSVTISQGLFDLFTHRPEVFSVNTRKTLWTDEHIAQHMLAAHLDPYRSAASRTFAEIDRSVAWFDSYFNLAGLRICDLGCGPGLYAARMAKLGAHVTGMDFSTSSIAYAQAQVGDASFPRYVQGDYLTDPLPQDLDCVALIYCDYCALPPDKRQRLLERIAGMLKPGGRLVLDVMSKVAFSSLEETASITKCPSGGFWSPEPYVEIKQTHCYPAEAISLDHHLIVQRDASGDEVAWSVYNWLQHYDLASLEQELRAVGFEVESALANLCGDSLPAEAPQVAVVATANGN